MFSGNKVCDVGFVGVLFIVPGHLFSLMNNCMLEKMACGIMLNGEASKAAVRAFQSSSSMVYLR